MSPELRASFEKQWPLLEKRIARMLTRHRVPQCMQEDLIQETAARLFGIWTEVDLNTSPWPLTATIALNLMRDQARAHSRTEVLAIDNTEVVAPVDVEESGIARFELGRVRQALGSLTAAQRDALIDDRVGLTPSEKMLRLRARKKLRALMERVPILVWLRARKAEPASAAIIYKDGVAQTIACVACALFGAAAIPFTLAPGQADARPLQIAGPGTVLGSDALTTDTGMSRATATYPHPRFAAVVDGGRIEGRSGDSTAPASAPSATNLPASAPLPVDGDDPTSSLPVGGGDAPVSPPPVNAPLDPSPVIEKATTTVHSVTTTALPTKV